MRIGIIGGGISGLTAAYWLAKNGHRVTVFEASNEVGGLAASMCVQGIWVDKFYHCILPSDTALLDLVTELGLGENIYWQETEMGFLYRGCLYPLTSPKDLLRFSPLSFVDRIRLGLTGMYGRYLRDWRSLENISARDWLVRFCGERAFNTVWKPLLVFKFGQRWQEAPATYLWARVKRQGTTRKGNSSKELLAYVKGGFKLIIEKLADEVRRLGVTIHTNTKVDRIVTESQRVKGLVVNDALLGFDKVISTVPIVQLVKLLDPHVVSGTSHRKEVSYQGAVCVVLALKERLSKYYWIPAVDTGVSFSGIVETTNLIRRDDLGKINLVYLVNYVPTSDPLYTMDKESLISRSVRELETVFKTFSSDQVLEAHVSKAAFVEPVWTLNYSTQLPERLSLNGTLAILTTAQLYPEINSTSNCVSQVKTIIPELMANANSAVRDVVSLSSSTLDDRRLDRQFV